MPRYPRSRLLRLLLGTLVATTAGIGVAAPATAAPVPYRHLSFDGTTLTVPSAWPVVDLAKHPRACVRFDVHAVYLGQPSTDQDCPSGLIGRSEAVLVEPSTAAPADITENRVAGEFDRVAGGVRIEAAYGTDRAAARAVMASARTTSTQTKRAPSAVPVRPAAVSGGVTNYSGYGFDACATPSAGTMNAWLSSPYRAVGVYIGGENRACAQPNLTASWVSQEAASGWHLIPLYVGRQAATSNCGCSAIQSPTADGVNEADDAANEAGALGLGSGATLYFDMENYASSSSATVLTFLGAWTNELHARGYTSGVYSSSSSGIHDLVTHVGSYTMPDVINDALWNGVANTADSSIPAGYWANHQRVHQYQGGHNETYGGSTINIDGDYLDVQVGASAAPRQVYEAASNNAWHALPVSGPSGTVTGSAAAAITLNGTKLLYTVNNGNVYEAASNDGWQNLWTGISGASDSALAAINLNGVKIIYTVINGTVYEAASNNGWRNLSTGITGVSGSALSVIVVDGVKYIYTIAGGVIHEASSANSWINLSTGIPATDLAAINLNGVKIIYSTQGGSVYEAASNAGWQDLWTGISGVSNTALAAIDLGGVKYIYTVAGGTIHEANSDNAWRNLDSGVGGSSVAAIPLDGYKVLYTL